MGCALERYEAILITCGTGLLSVCHRTYCHGATIRRPYMCFLINSRMDQTLMGSYM